MTIALKYTILAGDSYSTIAAALASCKGVTMAEVEAANPSIPASALQVGQVVVVPAKGTTEPGLNYTILPGDSYWAIANGVDACAGVSDSDIQAANSGLAPEALQVGLIINIPDANSSPEPSPEPLVPAENIGYWAKTWNAPPAPAGGTIALAFSGFTDPSKAIPMSKDVLPKLVGEKYITFGGGPMKQPDGTIAGPFTEALLTEVDKAIETGQLSDFQGIAYDVEAGDTGLADAFMKSFATAKAHGFPVLVTVSHSAPYDIDDAATLMKSFFANPNIDFLSPQLYTTGTEPQNDWDISGGVKWEEYTTSKAKIVPSIVAPSYYENAQKTFAGFGVTTAGYVVW